MSLRLSICRHCGQPVEQGKDLFSMWFHSRRYIQSTSRRCDPSDPNSTMALPAYEPLDAGEQPPANGPTSRKASFR